MVIKQCGVLTYLDDVLLRSGQGVVVTVLLLRPQVDLGDGSSPQSRLPHLLPGGLLTRPSREYARLLAALGALVPVELPADHPLYEGLLLRLVQLLGQHLRQLEVSTPPVDPLELELSAAPLGHVAGLLLHSGRLGLSHWGGGGGRSRAGLDHVNTRVTAGFNWLLGLRPCVWLWPSSYSNIFHLRAEGGVIRLGEVSTFPAVVTVTLVFRNVHHTGRHGAAGVEVGPELDVVHT